MMTKHYYGSKTRLRFHKLLHTWNLLRVMQSLPPIATIMRLFIAMQFIEKTNLYR